MMPLYEATRTKKNPGVNALGFFFFAYCRSK